MTTAPTPGPARDTGLTFFGTVTAGVGHELRNVFSILGQVDGLLRDHLTVMGRGTPLPSEVLGRVEERLDRLSRRGNEISVALGRLAHSVDTPRKSFDLNDCARAVEVLLRHRARRRQVSVVLRLHDEPLPVEGDEFGVLSAIYRCVAAAVESTGSGEIPVGVEADGEDVLVTVSVASESDRSEALEAELAALGRSADVRLELPRDESGRIPVLVLRVRATHS
jgi:signal transduction histidine kinase